MRCTTCVAGNVSPRHTSTVKSLPKTLALQPSQKSCGVSGQIVSLVTFISGFTYSRSSCLNVAEMLLMQLAGK